MELVHPSAAYKDSFLAAVKEFQADKDYPPMDRYSQLYIEKLENDFEDFVQKELSHAEGKNLPPGYVPENVYWLIDAGEFIGRLSLRHELTESLRKIGGHIGYEIRPGKRKQGYGSKILELGLEKAKAMGLDKVLLTCDVTNAGSRKIIEKNGGILEDQIPNPATGVDKLRFWIEAK